MKYHINKLDSEALFRLRVLDASKKNSLSVKDLCSMFGVSRSWFYKWKALYNPKNLNSLNSKSKRPKCIKTIPWITVSEVCEWKRLNPKKSHYYLYNLWIKQGRTPPCSSKTIYNYWKKRGLIITRHKRVRRKTKLFNTACMPGELVQIDTKYLEGRKRFQYTAIDVVSKWRVLRVYDKLNEANTIHFLDILLSKTKSKGIKVLLIQTDNGKEFQSTFRESLDRLGIKHQYTWIHTPDQNGVVERSHRTDEEEFYQETEISHLSTKELNEEIGKWETYYNTKRLHFSLNFDTPEEYLDKFKVSTM